MTTTDSAATAFDFAEAMRLYADIARKTSDLLAQSLQKPAPGKNPFDDEQIGRAHV